MAPRLYVGLLYFAFVTLVITDGLFSLLKTQIVSGSDNGCLKLFDVNQMPAKLGDTCCGSDAVSFEDFEQLTSVHVNSTDDKFLASGYSKGVALYDISSGRRLQVFTNMHQEPINVAKFAHHSPFMFATSSFDKDVKMWDLRERPERPCYTASSSRGNVMVCFSPDDLYLLVSAIDNEVHRPNSAVILYYKLNLFDKIYYIFYEDRICGA